MKQMLQLALVLLLAAGVASASDPGEPIDRFDIELLHPRLVVEPFMPRMAREAIPPDDVRAWLKDGNVVDADGSRYAWVLTGETPCLEDMLRNWALVVVTASGEQRTLARVAGRCNLPLEPAWDEIEIDAISVDPTNGEILTRFTTWGWGLQQVGLPYPLGVEIVKIKGLRAVGSSLDAAAPAGADRRR